MDLSIILPTYCEKDNIDGLISALERIVIPCGWQTEILVVDDDSPDDTACVVENHLPQQGISVRCFVRKQDRGLASAIQYGIRQSNGKWIVVMDTDFNHDPVMIPQMVRMLENFDLVIGSRFVKNGGMEDRKRYLFSLLYNLFVRVVLWVPTHDNLSGFFAMRRESLFALDLEQIFRGYGEYFIRLIHMAHCRGYAITEIPVFYVLRQHGDSKSQFGSMLIDYTRCVFEQRFTRK